MRISMLVLLLSLSSFAATAEDATAAAPGAAKPVSDAKIRAQLEELKYKFEVDGDGDYKLVFDVADSAEKRSQLVYVRSPVESYGALRVREIWSPGYKSEGADFPAAIANRLLTASQDNKVGAWTKQKEYAMFVVRLPAAASTEELDDAIALAITSADLMESQLTPGKDDL